MSAHTPLPPIRHDDGTASLLPLQHRGEVVAFALVDADVADHLATWGWGLSSKGYAWRREGRDGRSVHVYLHREVLGLGHGLGGLAAGVVDHLNGDRLDNRRANLRRVTHAENLRNRRGADRDSRSGVRGVSWRRRAGAWQAWVNVDGRNFHLGYFSDLDTAARAAECGRVILHGTADGAVAPTFDRTADPAEVRAEAQRMAAVLDAERAA